MLSTWPVQAVHAENSQAQHEVVGRWRLAAAIDGAEMVSLDEQEARQLVGKTFVIERDRVQFRGSIAHRRISRQNWSNPGFIWLSITTRVPKNWAFPTPVTVVHLDCTSVFVKSQNRLVIALKGWFFDAIRIRR